eukprot:PhM_4_TR5924/c2_g1_i2/m.71537
MERPDFDLMRDVKKGTAARRSTSTSSESSALPRIISSIKAADRRFSKLNQPTIDEIIAQTLSPERSICRRASADPNDNSQAADDSGVVASTTTPRKPSSASHGTTKLPAVAQSTPPGSAPARNNTSPSTPSLPSISMSSDSLTASTMLRRRNTLVMKQLQHELEDLRRTIDESETTYFARDMFPSPSKAERESSCNLKHLQRELRELERMEDMLGTSNPPRGPQAVPGNDAEGANEDDENVIGLALSECFARHDIECEEQDTFAALLEYVTVTLQMPTARVPTAEEIQRHLAAQLTKSSEQRESNARSLVGCEHAADLCAVVADGLLGLFRAEALTELNAVDDQLKQQHQRAADGKTDEADRARQEHADAEAKAEKELREARDAELEQQRAKAAAEKEADEAREAEAARKAAEDNAAKEKKEAEEAERERSEAAARAAKEAEEARVAEEGRRAAEEEADKQARVADEAERKLAEAEARAAKEAEEARIAEEERKAAEEKAAKEAEEARVAEEQRVAAEAAAKKEADEAAAAAEAARVAEGKAAKEAEEARVAEAERKAAEEKARAVEEEARIAQQAAAGAARMQHEEAETMDLVGNEERTRTMLEEEQMKEMLHVRWLALSGNVRTVLCVSHHTSVVEEGESVTRHSLAVVELLERHALERRCLEWELFKQQRKLVRTSPQIRLAMERSLTVHLNVTYQRILAFMTRRKRVRDGIDSIIVGNERRTLRKYYRRLEFFPAYLRMRRGQREAATAMEVALRMTLLRKYYNRMSPPLLREAYLRHVAHENRAARDEIIHRAQEVAGAQRRSMSRPGQKREQFVPRPPGAVRRSSTTLGGSGNGTPRTPGTPVNESSGVGLDSTLNSTLNSTLSMTVTKRVVPAARAGRRRVR